MAVVDPVARVIQAYNGLTWRGVRLRVERAKEDYKARLVREWAEAGRGVAAAERRAEEAEAVAGRLAGQG